MAQATITSTSIVAGDANRLTGPALSAGWALGRSRSPRPSTLRGVIATDANLPGFLLKATRWLAWWGRRHLFITSYFEERRRASGRLAAHYMWVDGEVFCSLILFVLASLAVAAWPWTAFIFVPLAIVRLLNILAFSLANVVFETKTGRLASAQRTIVLSVLNLFAVAALFVVFDEGWQALSHAFLDPKFPLDSWPQFVYMSWTSLLTMGSGYDAANGVAQALIGMELGCGVFLIAVTIAVLVGSVRWEERHSRP